MSSRGQLDPHTGRAINLEVASRPIAAIRCGADGAPDVLLVPGYTGSKEDFNPILDALAAAGFRVTSIDLPGQFESPGPDEPASYVPDLLAHALLEISDQLSEQPHLLGHSFGGLVARAAVIAAPHRFRDLVLMSSGPAALQGARRQRIETLSPILPAAGLPGVWAAMQAAFAAEPGYIAPPVTLAQFLEGRFVGGSAAMLQGMGDALISEPDRVDELRATGIRTLVTHGANDDAWPPDVQKDMAARLGAQYVVIPRADHSPAVENPDATVAALLEFWRAS